MSAMMRLIYYSIAVMPLFVLSMDDDGFKKPILPTPPELRAARVRASLPDLPRSLEQFREKYDQAAKNDMVNSKFILASHNWRFAATNDWRKMVTVKRMWLAQTQHEEGLESKSPKRDRVRDAISSYTQDFSYLQELAAESGMFTVAGLLAFIQGEMDESYRHFDSAMKTDKDGVLRLMATIASEIVPERAQTSSSSCEAEVPEKRHKADV